jgi:hypothetical protein
LVALAAQIRRTYAFVTGDDDLRLPGDALSNVDGDGNYVRVQVLTTSGRSTFLSPGDRP